MLTLLADQAECLWDEALPIGVRELPEDLAALDVLLADPEVLWPLVERWRREFQEMGRLVHQTLNEIIDRRQALHAV